MAKDYVIWKVIIWHKSEELFCAWKQCILFKKSGERQKVFGSKCVWVLLSLDKLPTLSKSLIDTGWIGWTENDNIEIFQYR